MKNYRIDYEIRNVLGGGEWKSARRYGNLDEMQSDLLMLKTIAHVRNAALMEQECGPWVPFGTKAPATGTLEVGTNGEGEVIINHPDLLPDANGCGHIVFSPGQARELAKVLAKKAAEADNELIELVKQT